MSALDGCSETTVSNGIGTADGSTSFGVGSDSPEVIVGEWGSGGAMDGFRAATTTFEALLNAPNKPESPLVVGFGLSACCGGDVGCCPATDAANRASYN